jgi:hypothetical protein
MHQLIRPSQDLAYNQKWFKNHTLALSILNVKHPLIPLEENPDIVWSRFIESVNKTNASKIIVSSEVFMEGVDRERIKNYLRNFQVRIILYLREQSDWIDSLYTEEVKHGYNKSVCEYFDAAKDSKFNYYEEVERWSKVFGKNSLHVRDYSEAVRSKGLLEDFFALVGLAENDMQNLEIIGDRSNVRFPAELVDILIRFNSLPLPLNEKIKIREHFIYLINKYSEISDMKKFSVPDSLKYQVRSYCVPSNKKLSESYGNGKDFFFDSAR